MSRFSPYTLMSLESYPELFSVPSFIEVNDIKLGFTKRPWTVEN